jgi:hypothetical protein
MYFPYIHNIPPCNKKNDDTRTLLKRNWTDLDFYLNFGRWLKPVILIIYGRLLNFVTFVNVGWMLLFIVLYSWISLLVVNNCLLLIVNNSTEYVHWEHRVIICMFLKVSLQELLGQVLVVILMIFFCSMNTLLA